MSAFLISYAGMEEQPAKRAKLGSFTTSGSIFTTQGAVGSSVLSNAEYPAMHAHYDNPTVNASISPIVQNIVMDTTGFNIQDLFKGEDGKTPPFTFEEVPMFRSWVDNIKGDPNWAGACGVPMSAMYDKTSNTYKLGVGGSKTVMFCEPPVKIKKNLYQVSRVVGGVASVQNFSIKIAFTKIPKRNEAKESEEEEEFNARQIAWISKPAKCKAGQVGRFGDVSMVYHQPDSDGKHKVNIQQSQ